MSHEGALPSGIASLPVLDAKTFTLVGLTASGPSFAICCVSSASDLASLWSVFFCLQNYNM